MTNKDKLIELLESAESAVYWDSSDNGFLEKIADHLIANGVTFGEDINALSKWIPVDERLPEQVKEVLAFSAEFGEYQIGWLAFSDEEQCGVVCVGDGIELYKVPIGRRFLNRQGGNDNELS